MAEQDNQNKTQKERFQPDWHDPWRGLFWGLLLILLGVLFLADLQGWLDNDTWWQYLLIGMGIIFLIDGVVHYFTSEPREPSFGRFIPGVILLFVGIAFVYGLDRWWPIALIAGGLVILLSLFRIRH